MRDAFWQSGLGFCDISTVPAQLEFMLRVLLSVEMADRGRSERRYDLFRGDPLFWTFYMCWLGTAGLLVETGRLGVFEDRLSPEGRWALMMLMATREPEWEDMPIADVIAAVVASSRVPSDLVREQALREFELSVGIRRHVFAREMVGGCMRSPSCRWRPGAPPGCPRGE